MPAVSKPGFGQRQSTVVTRSGRGPSLISGLQSLPEPRIQPARKPAISGRTGERTADAVRDTATSFATSVQTTAAATTMTFRDKVRWYWIYMKACVVAFATALGLASLLSSGIGLPLPSFLNTNILVAIVVAPSISAAFFWPAIIAWNVVALFRLPRGVADVVTGGLVGSLFIIAPIVGGDLPNVMSVCFLFGGCAGGFAYWRGQGYPGRTSGEAAALNAAFKFFPR